MENNMNRWWENYLVRYLMPSLGGMILIRIIFEIGDGKYKKFVPAFTITDSQFFSSAHLIIWFICGSFFCFLASYPILVFHVTRVIDFKEEGTKVARIYFNPYLHTLIFGILSLSSAYFNCISLAYVAVIFYMLIQIARLAFCFFKQDKFKTQRERISFSYAYLVKLSKRRSTIENKETIKDNDEDEGSSTTEIRSNRDKDIADSYRHLREHGNTAFIILLEIFLTPIVLVAISSESYAGLHLGLLISLWILPSVFIYWFGQHLERLYSLFKF